jgi:hypothetical protein
MDAVFMEMIFMIGSKVVPYPEEKSQRWRPIAQQRLSAFFRKVDCHRKGLEQ